ncbi:MAG: protein kinase, partial [bacterium]|nr:protein kinase [bacterium]
MGVVYRARQTVLHRDIAIKAAKFGTQSDESQAIKFISEALITASLEHPNVVPVHNLTTTPNQRLALAMKLIGGMSWRDILRPSTEAHKKRAEEVDLEFHLDVLLAVANAVA